MAIRMPMIPGNYELTVRKGGQERKGRCQKVSVRELGDDEREHYGVGLDQDAWPTHQILYYDFGCKRIVEGRMIEDTEDRAVFVARDGEYEFSPIRMTVR